MKFKTIFSRFDTQQTIGAAYTTLYSNAIKANSLNREGSILSLEYYINPVFGGGQIIEVLFDGNVVASIGASVNGKCVLRVNLLVNDSGNLKGYLSGQVDAGGSGIVTDLDINVDLTQDFNIDIAAQSQQPVPADGDIIASRGIGLFYPASKF